MHKVTRAIAVVNTRKAGAAALGGKISAFLQARGVFCRIFQYDGTEVGDPFASYDFAITLGGDGTVLFAARYCAPKGIPVFPVNLGEFGFIAGIGPERWQDALLSYLEGNSHSTERMLLGVEVQRGADNGTVYRSCALNDCTVSGGLARIVEFRVSFQKDGGEYSFGLFKADGVIAATPTGSTAYSAAAGGPILSPDLSAFVLSPVCAFSLSSRPIVLPASGKIRISFAGTSGFGTEGLLTVDGQETFALQPGDGIIISRAAQPVRLIGCAPETFYQALRYKLNWSGAPVSGAKTGETAAGEAPVRQEENRD